MTAHISERVLLLASDQRDILRRKRPEQSLVTDALSASSPPARCSLDLEASSGAGRLRQLQGGAASRLARDGSAQSLGSTQRAGLSEVGRRRWRCCSAVTGVDVKLTRDPSPRLPRHRRGRLGCHAARRARWYRVPRAALVLVLVRCCCRRRPAGCGRLIRPRGNPVLLAAPAGLARCRRRVAPGICLPAAQLPGDSPIAGWSCCCDASGTRAAGEQAHMITNRPPRPVIATGTSSLQKGDQLPCPQ